MSAAELIAVAMLGGAGALARFAIDGGIATRLGGPFPVGTLGVNLSGAFLLGLLSGSGAGGEAPLLIGTAALGGYTTFSTWMLESQRLGEDGERRLMVANLIGSLLAGLAAFALGHWIGGAL